jgi:hypothetical protein
MPQSEVTSRQVMFTQGRIHATRNTLLFVYLATLLPLLTLIQRLISGYESLRNS